MRRPATPWLGELHDQLMADARAEALADVKTAVLMTGRCSRREVGQRLDLEASDVKRAVTRVRKVSARLEPGRRPQI